MGNASSCPVETKPEDPQGFVQNGEIFFKAHQVGWIVSGFFALIATVVSAWLIRKHLSFYTDPGQQRYIVRILFLVPIYAIVSWFSYFWWHEAIYFQLARDCYEAIVLASFFQLLLSYLGETPDEIRQVFKKVQLQHWLFPMGFVKYRPVDGLYFLWLMKWGIYQYVVLRPLSTLVAVITQALGVYCLASWSPQFSHIYCSIVICVSVTIAMYCVLQLYHPVAKELAPYKPIMKFLAVKAVVFLTFWQESFLSLLIWFKVIKESHYWTAEEIQVGIGAILETFEMAIFAFVHIKAFTYLAYRPPLTDPKERVEEQTDKWKALLHVLDFRDVTKEIGDGSKVMVRKIKGVPIDVDRRDDLEEAIGVVRHEAEDEDEDEIEEEEEEADDGWLDEKRGRGMERKGSRGSGRTSKSRKNGNDFRKQKKVKRRSERSHSMTEVERDLLRVKERVMDDEDGDLGGGRNSSDRLSSRRLEFMGGGKLDKSSGMYQAGGRVSFDAIPRTEKPGWSRAPMSPSSIRKSGGIEYSFDPSQPSRRQDPRRSRNEGIVHYSSVPVLPHQHERLDHLDAREPQGRWVSLPDPYVTMMGFGGQLGLDPCDDNDDGDVDRDGDGRIRGRKEAKSGQRGRRPKSPKKGGWWSSLRKKFPTSFSNDSPGFGSPGEGGTRSRGGVRDELAQVQQVLYDNPVQVPPTGGGRGGSIIVHSPVMPDASPNPGSPFTSQGMSSADQYFPSDAHREISDPVLSSSTTQPHSLQQSRGVSEPSAPSRVRRKDLMMPAPLSSQARDTFNQAARHSPPLSSSPSVAPGEIFNYPRPHRKELISLSPPPPWHSPQMVTAPPPTVSLLDEGSPYPQFSSSGRSRRNSDSMRTSVRHSTPSDHQAGSAGIGLRRLSQPVTQPPQSPLSSVSNFTEFRPPNVDRWRQRENVGERTRTWAAETTANRNLGLDRHYPRSGPGRGVE